MRPTFEQSYDESEERSLSTVDHFADDFGDEPIYKCTNCASKNPGYEEKEGSLLTVIAAILSLIVFKLYAFLILPLVIESTKTIIKKCVKCDHVLDKQELLSLPSLTDNILSFKCGGCAVVLSRKYALGILGVLIVIWFFLPGSAPVVNPGGIELQNAKWEEYITDCGRNVILSNQVRAKKNFETKYSKNIVSWEGVVQKKILTSISGEVGALHVKMNPSDSKSDIADIQLTIPHSLASKNMALFNQFVPGDVFKFKGTIIQMGDEFHYHHFEAIEVTSTGQKFDLSKIPTMTYSGNAPSLRKSTESINTGLVPVETSSSSETKKEEEEKKTATDEQKPTDEAKNTA
jgi:hypothetical protein